MQQYSRSQVQALSDDLERMIHETLPDAETSSELSNLGEIMIDVKMQGKFIVVEWLLNDVYGVTEVNEVNGFMRDFDASFATADEAVRYLSQLFPTPSQE